jgi:hypothetical protein
MKKTTLLLVLMIMAACSGAGKGPPRNLDDACSMMSQRPGWQKNLQASQDKWGVPIPMFLAAIYQESKFVPDARTNYRYALGVIPMGRQSSAYGYAQAIDSTWDWYKRSEGGFGAKRNNFEDSVDFMGWYMNESFERNGISKFDMYNQYLAYHDGHAGYKRGSYRKKKWLTRIAGEVQSRAILYQNQLRTCGG